MRLCIYCAGGLGREVLDVAHRVNKEFNRWEEIFFIDDEIEENEICETKVYKFKDIIEKLDRSNTEFTIANGEPAIREKLFNRLKEHKLKIATIIAVDAIISPFVKIGEGVTIFSGAIISNNACLEKGVFLNFNCIVGHDVKIDEFTVVSPGSSIGGFTLIGRRSYIGLNACIKDRIKIEDNVIIGMGSVVFKDVSLSKIVIGNPAREIAINDKHRVFK
ncbi:acetyltransferase [Tepidibacter sp. Z1-5]|uniref:acetyltransferase n=1 Tax=Tepidibacter sp. Z1-5 TaxID=3134138 RepID=UPI0030BEB763